MRTLIASAFALSLLAGAVPALAAAPAVAVQAQPMTEAELEAAAEAFGAVVEQMEAQAAPIRADASLSAAEKEARIMAIIAPHQSEIDAFADMVTGFVISQAMTEGATPEEAATQGEMVRGIIGQAIVQSIITGEAPGGE